ncbi:MAG: Bifunctional PGK/TIM [Chlamydiae bacterium]|nr:Bifunctional PGK/TIM [Chlamydiota bacterium]
MRKLFKVICNWKMNKTISEAIAFCKAVPPLVSPVYLAVPFTCLQPLADLDIPMLQIGAQNLYPQHDGAFTGEVSASMIKETGAEFVILGHSERRQIFSETNEFVNQKVKAALLQDLVPIVCIGETAIEKNQNRTREVLKKQLLESLKDLDTVALKQIHLAYEPIWAIGTGTPSTPQSAQEIHFHLRQLIQEEWGEDVAENMSILYGGSVSDESIEELKKQPDIDGALVGGASLKLETFSKIIALVEGDPK